MPTDRTELHDVAAQHPDIVERMVEAMARHDRECPHGHGKETKPVATEATAKNNPEWTDYDAPAHRRQNQGQRPNARPPSDARRTLPRARNGTKLTVEGKQLILHCTGNDPGLAFDMLAELKSPGPYTLEFPPPKPASGDGELFWTTDAGTMLPKGEHLDFQVIHDGQWHDVTLQIAEPKPLHACASIRAPAKAKSASNRCNSRTPRNDAEVVAVSA